MSLRMTAVRATLAGLWTALARNATCIQAATASAGPAFRTTNQNGKLVGSFLTEFPDKFEAAVKNSSSFSLISIEKVTPEMFVSHEAAPQESM